ncbi:hypothetical protein FGE12_06165 [Aggregicoccus sp. 17bor-14]|uniref:inner membrane CreD family protein n=1 Tax=Myxococcaceae TaxID=31 RepID=UPI00129C97B5|nr:MULTISPECIES: inner membrane CreD family protein [Myxococcaceae]MBF5041970.1 inner membrane CreD family protein [Simulacricoccus sp. 17bor-14]MRI87751.1 hypothetical protein [Aggregicoccus sp. 17bor-14]
MRNLLAIGFIWVGCALAWTILGSTLVARSGESSSELLGEVHALWGSPMVQEPPTALYREKRTVTETVSVNDAQGLPHVQTVQREEEVPRAAALERSSLEASLSLEQRRKGLLWFPTYAVDFRGQYVFVNPDAQPQELEFSFPLQKDSVGYDGFAVHDAAGALVPTSIADGTARWRARVGPGERTSFSVGYRSRGTERWEYALTEGTGQVRHFSLLLRTDDARVDFPVGSLSPSRHAATGRGWEGEWEFESLVSSARVGVALPGRLNPGPLAARITFFAPVGLLFFFFVVGILATVQGQRLHPANYFLFGCAFFAFHLLFAYLVDHLPIAPAFTLAAVVSVALATTYARLFVGWRFALRELGGAQLVYLVLFSLTFMWEGFTGLAITVGAILTLFMVMQVTGRVDWRQLGLPRDPVTGAPKLG